KRMFSSRRLHTAPAVSSRLAESGGLPCEVPHHNGEVTQPALRERRVWFRDRLVRVVIGGLIAGWLVSAAPAHADRADRFGPARAALDANPGNSTAWCLAGDFLEQAGDPRAVDVRRELVVNEPWELAHRVRLIHTALRFQELPQAE